jgi:hypothetical protein
VLHMEQHERWSAVQYLYAGDGEHKAGRSLP